MENVKLGNVSLIAETVLSWILHGKFRIFAKFDDIGAGDGKCTNAIVLLPGCFDVWIRFDVVAEWIGVFGCEQRAIVLRYVGWDVDFV